jgi:hypothetical protein
LPASGQQQLGDGFVSSGGHLGQELVTRPCPQSPFWPPRQAADLVFCHARQPCADVARGATPGCDRKQLLDSLFGRIFGQQAILRAAQCAASGPMHGRI